MKTDYSAIDSAILQLIQDGVNTFGAIYQHPTIEAAVKDTFKSEPGARIDIYRLADRRLQALRKAGKITQIKVGRKWAIA